MDRAARPLDVRLVERRAFQIALSGNDFATLASSRTSAIIRNMTAPRYVSTDPNAGRGPDWEPATGLAHRFRKD